MSKAIILKKNLIWIVIAALVLATTAQVYRTQAAERVDLTKEVKLTAEVSSLDDSAFATEFTGTVEIKLFKLAVMDATGGLSSTGAFTDPTIDLEVLRNNPTVETIKEKIVAPALTIAEGMAADYTIYLDRGTGETKVSKEIAGGAGLYLYIPQKVVDSRNTYTFIPYIIQTPTSEFVMAGTGSDDWQYEAVFNLKASEQPRFSSLTIEKKLDKFNATLGTASFVYKVKATRDGMVVHDNVYSINFNSATQNSYTITDIPADSTVEVTEVYDGASYKVVGNKTYDNITVNADSVTTVTFENDYDGGLIQGGISAVNQFEEENGIIYWIDENGARVQQ